LRSKGFTLIELLVVIVIIGILVAIALPNFIKVKDKAKEAEVKQNLHAIQLAVERYATDEDGNYPYFLYGGTALFNIGVVSYFQPGDGNTAYPWIDSPVHNPFDMFWHHTNTWDYEQAGDWGNLVNPQAASQLKAAFGDSLAFEGFMPKYPKNPFQTARKAQLFGLDALQTQWNKLACVGGDDGTKMWDLGYGMGELPMLQQFSNDKDGSLAYPGNFYYHPRFSDGVTSSGHFGYQSGDNPSGTNYNDGSWVPDLEPLNDARQVSSLDVAAYDLIAVGSPRTKGQDLDNSVSLQAGSDNFWRTGYVTLGQERNPWVRAADYDNVQDFDERPYSDSVPDFYIIHLSSGLDKKVGNPLDQSQ